MNGTIICPECRSIWYEINFEIGISVQCPYCGKLFRVIQSQPDEYSEEEG